jgi:hypothetical protein
MALSICGRHSLGQTSDVTDAHRCEDSKRALEIAGRACAAESPNRSKVHELSLARTRHDIRLGSVAPAKLEYRRQEVGDLRTNHRKEFRALAKRVGNVRQFIRGQLRAQRCEVGHGSGIAL